jgi:hypothetical protein
MSIYTPIFFENPVSGEVEPVQGANGALKFTPVLDSDTAGYAAEVLIAAATAADTAELFVPQGMSIPITAFGLAGAETIAVEVYTPSGYVQYVTGGTSVSLSVTNNKIAFDIPGRYRLNKGVTAGAAGVLRDQA